MVNHEYTLYLENLDTNPQLSLPNHQHLAAPILTNYLMVHATKIKSNVKLKKIKQTDCMSLGER